MHSVTGSVLRTVIVKLLQRHRTVVVLVQEIPHGPHILEEYAHLMRSVQHETC